MTNNTKRYHTLDRPHFIEGTKWPLAVDAQMTPPIPCLLRVGDAVKFTNGAEFSGLITGFSPDVSYGRFVYWDNSAWWFAARPDEFTLLEA